MTRNRERQRLIRRLKATAAECRQIIADVGFWNANRPIGTEPLDADPDEELENTIRWCERNIELLKKEGGEE